MTYIYKEYPRTLHKWPGLSCTVRTDDEKAVALADGWSLLPVTEAPRVEVGPGDLTTEAGVMKAYDERGPISEVTVKRRHR